MPAKREFSFAFLLLVQLVCLGSALGEFQGQADVHNSTQQLDVLWKCRSDVECTADKSSCVQGQCQCVDGFTFNVNRTTCLQVATAYKDQCTETIQCSSYLFSGAICADGACICAQGFHYLHGRCYPSAGLNESCRSNEECFVNAEFGAASCVDGICRCSPGFYQREYRTCRRAGRKIEDECVIDMDCNFQNATCNRKYKCEMENERKRREVVDNGSNVSQPVKHDDKDVAVGSKCLGNSDCASLGNATCHSTERCVCARAHFPSNDNSKCVPELGEPCRPEDEPLIKKSVCRDNVWSCVPGMTHLKDNRVCKKIVKKYAFSCLTDEQCNIFGPDAVCKDKKCLCNERSHFVGNELFCWTNKEVGEKCQSQNDCHISGFSENLVCEGNVCRCPDGKHLNSNKIACIDSQAELGMVCEVDRDCIIDNSACINNNCTCKENFYENNGKCLLGLNGKCSTDDDCSPENSVCQETCGCKENFTALSVDSCVPVASMGESCQHDVQCSTQTPLAVCESTEIKKSSPTSKSNGVCKCKEGHHFAFGKCNRMKVLGESCKSLGECYLETNLSMVHCMNEKCSCNWGYEQESKTTCVEKRNTGGSALNAPSWLLIIPLVLKLSALA